jgi:hypothetical protein
MRTDGSDHLVVRRYQYPNSIFRRLGVSSRTQAVAEARALHLLTD